MDYSDYSPKVSHGKSNTCLPKKMHIYSVFDLNEIKCKVKVQSCTTVKLFDSVFHSSWRISGG